jgi:phosphatidyl-myo-inositol dimannoside synthase
MDSVQMKKRYLFLTLNIFSATGGIEKVCRAAGKALYEIATENGNEVVIYSMHDKSENINEAYFPEPLFKAFDRQKLKFTLSALFNERGADMVLLSHINLLPIGYLLKKLSPKSTLVLIAHGIEVWDRLPQLKLHMLNAVDLFLPVSNYTATQLQETNRIDAEKIRVVNNCLDPFLKNDPQTGMQDNLRNRYHFSNDDLVLLTVTRLKHSEQYKGYDKVIASLADMKKNSCNVKYLIVGKYDNEEKKRLDAMIMQHQLQEDVVFAGFVPDQELSAHFNLADVYIMPSTGEGFGIVFIEALSFGLPVIAGNQDGSVDALGNGQFGLLVNPNNPSELTEAISKMAANRQAYVPDQEKVAERFGFETYKNNLRRVLGLSKEPEVHVKDWIEPSIISE